MDRYEFLRTILPPEGNGTYVSTFDRPSDDVTWNQAYDTIEALADACVEASNAGLVAYYALGTYTNNITTQENGRKKVGRKATMANRFKTLAVDIDAGKKSDVPSYETSEAAMQDIVRFIKETSLPVPMVISSGKGFHCYWPLAEDISKEEWVKAGIALRGFCTQHNLRIDPSKVHDASMVLRPMDTLNKGVLVRMIVSGAGSVDFSSFVKKIGFTATKQPPGPSGKTVLNDMLLMSMQETYAPIEPDKIVTHCLQMKEATRDHGAHASYYQWFYALGMAKHAVDPIAAATEWTKGHPEYSADTMQSKMDSYEADGPPSCTTFNLNVPNICTKCPHWGKIANPYRLGVPSPKPIDETKDAQHIPSVPALPVEEIIANVRDFKIDPMHCSPPVPPPLPFKRTEKGIGFERDGVWNSVCDYDIFPSHIVRDISLEYSMVEWVWKKPHAGYTRMLIKTAHIFNDSSPVELNNTLADNGLLIESRLKQIQMGQYMRAYTQQLQRHQASVDLYDSFGWKDNFSRFVLGSTEFRKEKDGSVSAHEVGISKMILKKEFDKTFSAKGNIEEWKTWTRVLDHPTLAIHQIELARGFMAPLLQLTGLRGVVFSFVGESGMGKTAMQRWAASIYGNPEKVNTTANDTQMSIVQRMGVWNCLPLAVDEVTLAKPELLANLVYWGTQGQDRNRVTETTQANTWALPLSLSTNRRVRDKIATVGADVDALNMRILEFGLRESPIFTEVSNFGRRIYLMSGDHYGLIGRVYLPFLVGLGEDRIRQDIDDHIKYIDRTYNPGFVGKERFWQMSVVICDLGCKYASQLGLIQYDYTKGTKAMIEELMKQRDSVAVERLDSFDMVTEYLNQHNDATVRIKYSNGNVTPMNVPRSHVRVRQELYYDGANTPNRGFFYVDRSHFHHWLIGKGFDFKTAVDDMTGAQAAFRPSKSGRIYLAKDTGVALPSCAAIGFNMKHDRFAGMLQQFVDIEQGGNVVDINAARGDKR